MREKLNYVNLDRIKREHAHYNWLIGERSNGKTFAVLKEMIINYVNEVVDKVGNLLIEGEKAQIIRDGLKVAIVGKPNVGKSSLLNALLQEDKAIVTEIPGTTRDVVEGQVNLGGIPLNLFDTAGIRETDDVIESIGINKSVADRQHIFVKRGCSI